MRSTEKILNVPALTQRDNVLYPSSTCNTTSLAMVAQYYQIRSLEAKQLEDIFTEISLEKWAQDQAVREEGSVYRLRAREVWSVLVSIIRKFTAKITSAAVTALTIDEICDQIDADRPVIIGGNFPCGSSTIGHFHVIIGYTDNGNTFIVNDPWGDPNTAYTSTNGKGVKISRANAETWWRNAGNGKKLTIMVYGKQHA